MTANQDENREPQQERQDEHDPGAGGSDGLETIPGIPSSGTSLSENLERTNRHPVLIFGSSRSGKSSLILSLIRSLQAARTVDVELGEPVLDRADPKSAEKHQLAKRLYDWQSYLLDKGQAIDANRDAFFVPLDIRPRNSLLPPVKLAFLDSVGESWVPFEDEENPDFYKAFSPEIVELLQTFSYAITVICIAPYSISSRHDRDTRASNFGLLGALRGYKEFRTLRRKDFHLLLFTKWDQFAPPLDSKTLFDLVGPGDVDPVLSDRYRQAWGAFQAIPLEGPAQERRAFMQYSSGYYVEGRPRQPPASFAASFDRYPRTVLNWLYGNATQFKVAGDAGAWTLRKILFEDVVHPGEPRVTMTDRLAALLTSR